MRARRLIRAGLVVLVVLLLDQLSKHLVRRSIVPGEEHKVLPGVGLVNTRNHGVAFGFLPGDQTAVTIVIGIALLALLVYFALPRHAPLLWLPTGMLLGGALGNILDRVRDGSVTDFIKLPLGWPPVQPRRHLDHARRRDPVPRDRPLPPRRAMTGSSGRARDPFTIAYQDEHLMVIDKAPGVVVHPARGHREGTLAQLLAPLLPAGGDPEFGAGIVHRLDRDTSGLLVVARSQEAHSRLQAAIAARLVEREYLALVQGRPPARSGTIDAPIGRDPRVRTRMAIDGAGAREARTHFTLERALAEQSLLRLRLETGRTHQIRVHLQAIGHPVCGDPEYGGAGALGLERQFLHATRLAFAHPLSGEPIEWNSPLPADLRGALERAERLS